MKHNSVEDELENILKQMEKSKVTTKITFIKLKKMLDNINQMLII